MGEEGLPPEIFEKLLKEYQKGIPERLQALRAAITALRKEGGNERIETVRFLVHKMAGNAGTFGYKKVSQLCKAWDEKLAKMEPNGVTQALLSDLDALFKTIEKEYESIDRR